MARRLAARVRGARRGRRLPGAVGPWLRRLRPGGSLLLELRAVLDVDAAPDALTGRTSLLVHAERALGLGALAFRDPAGVADADRRDERDAVDVLDDALDVGDQVIRRALDPA